MNTANWLPISLFLGVSIFRIDICISANTDGEIVVRPAEKVELEEVLALDRRISYEYWKPIYLLHSGTILEEKPDDLLEEDLEEDEEIFEQAVSGEGGYRLYVASKGNAIVGFTLISLTENNLIFEIFMVDKEYRRQGIGRKMINHVLNEVSWTSCRTDVMKKNRIAVQFIESLGFKPLDQKPDDMGNDYPEEVAHAYRYYEYKMSTFQANIFQG